MKKLIMLLFMLVIVAACQSQASNSRPSGPTRSELCKVLGYAPESDKCKYDTDAKLKRLFEEAFPPGSATIDKVRTVMEPYLLESKVYSTGSTVERYAIEQTLFPDNPVSAIFTFDGKGVLVSITILD